MENSDFKAIEEFPIIGAPVQRPIVSGSFVFLNTIERGIIITALREYVETRKAAEVSDVEFTDSCYAKLIIDLLSQIE